MSCNIFTGAGHFGELIISSTTPLIPFPLIRIRSIIVGSCRLMSYKYTGVLLMLDERDQLNETYCRSCFVICPTNRLLPRGSVWGPGLGTGVCITGSCSITRRGPWGEGNKRAWQHLIRIFLKNLRGETQITLISGCRTLESNRGCGDGAEVAKMLMQC